MLIFLTVLIPLMPVQAQKKQQSIKETVAKINRELFDALIDGDAEEISSLYTSGGTLFPPNGESVKGKSAIREYWAGSISSSKTLRVETQTIDFELYGTDTAYESGSYQLDYKLPDESEIQTAEGIYLIIWKRVDDTWKLHIDMWN